LSIPALRRTFKSMYLPIGIVWAAAGALAEPIRFSKLGVADRTQAAILAIRAGLVKL
jgi:hypothetical protein